MEEEIDDFDQMENFLSKKALLIDSKWFKAHTESNSDKQYQDNRKENREVEKFKRQLFIGVTFGNFWKL